MVEQQKDQLEGTHLPGAAEADIAGTQLEEDMEQAVVDMLQHIWKKQPIK